MIAAVSGDSNDQSALQSHFCSRPTRSTFACLCRLFSRSQILGHHTSAARRKFLRILQVSVFELIIVDSLLSLSLADLHGMGLTNSMLLPDMC